MVEQNRKEFDTLGITKWQALYKGQGMSIAEMEPFNPALPIWNGKTRDPFNNWANGDTNSGHGYKVANVMKQVCPEATIYTIPNISGVFDATTCNSPWVDNVLPFLKDNVDILGVSLSSSAPYALSLQNKIKEAQDKVLFIYAAGNDNSIAFNQYTNNNVVMAIGAVHWSDSLQAIEKANYSSVGPELDFVSFSGLYIEASNSSGVVFREEGTSFAQPLFSGMVLLVQQFFKEKTGRKLSQAQMYQFVKDHCKDLGAAGFDIYHGHGLFVLPDPATIDVNKYLYYGKTVIRFIQNGSSYSVNGGEQKFIDTQFLVKDGRTFAPVRFVAEELGCKVDWNQATNTATITKGSVVISFAVGSNGYTVNGVRKIMDTTTFFHMGRTMVPIRFFAEALGCEVLWNSATKEVTVIL